MCLYLCSYIFCNFHFIIQNLIESSCTYVLGLKILPPFLPFPIIYWSCSSCVCCFFVFFHSIITERSETYYILNLLCLIYDVEIQLHTVSRSLSLVWLYLCIVFIADICITIKSHQSNQECSTTWRTFIHFKYSSYFISYCNLHYLYMCNLSILRSYAKYLNSTTK